MRLGFEQKLREKHSEKYDVIVVEYMDTRTKETYCRIHRNFHDSGRITDVAFEELCKMHKWN